jgi:hypothetical protein
MPTQPKFITAPDIADRLIEALTVGCYREEAADYAGIDRGTMARWIDRGESHKAMTETYQQKLEDWQANGKKGKAPPAPDPEEKPYATLATQIKAAEAQARVMAVTTVRSAMAQPGGKGWIAAMTYLERKDPAKWGRRDRTTNVNLNLDASKMDLSGLSDAELASFNAIIQKLSPQEEGE